MRVLLDIAVVCGILVVPIAAVDVALTRRARRSRMLAEQRAHEAHEMAEQHAALSRR